MNDAGQTYRANTIVLTLFAIATALEPKKTARAE